MKWYCVYFILFFCLILNVIGIEGRWKRRSDDFDHDSKSADESNEYEPFGENDNHDELTERWGKKPEGWQKGNSPCGKPGLPSCPNGLPGSSGEPGSTGQTSAPNKQQPNKPQPTEPSVPKETRPTFITTKEPHDPNGNQKPTPPNNNSNEKLEPAKETTNGSQPDNHEVYKCMRLCHMTAEDEPVCGNNGVTYINPWHFKCAQHCKIAVTTFTRGVCPSKSCDANGSSTETIKECIRNCPVTAERDPVCGSNGMTYDNSGHLLCARKCGVVVDLLSKGPCRGKEPTVTETSDKEPTSTPSSNEIKQCKGRCPVTSEYNPLCGSDGVTYTNSGRFACAKNCGANVVIIHKGVCRDPTPSTDGTIIRTTPHSVMTKACLSRCPTTPDYNPVCGTDLVTYSNPGKLYCAQSCGSDVTVLRKGPCSGNNPPISPNKDPVTPVNTAAPVVTVTPNPATPSATPSNVARECMKKCPSTPEYNPVCGTDYVTYDNPGKLQCAQSCGTGVKELRHGPCPTRPTPATTASSTNSGSSTTQSAQVKNCMEKRCPMTPEYNPVCGTDYVTYSNPGKLNCAKFCGADVSMLRHGRCPSPPTTTIKPTTEPMTPAWRWE